MIVRHPARRRGGATTAEVAVVISVFLLFLFGVFEYCRFIMMLQATTNAARDSARYAVVNIAKPDNFDRYDYKDPSNRVYPSVVKYARQRLSGVDKMIASPTPTQYYSDIGAALGPAYCKIEVFPCDPVLLNPTQPAPPAPQIPPVVAPKPGFTYWNEAEFGQRIAVRVSGDYKPALPNFLLMGATIPVNIVVTMGSEG